ncbi:MAG TPA: hypothetical protein VII50_03810 [Acidothermaceae bacterium]
MTGAWVGADVRAVAMSRRTVGRAGAASIAACADLTAALAQLQSSPYARDVRPSHDLANAQRAVASTLLWNVRVIAGWVPASGVGMLRIAMAWFEILNLEARLRPADRGPVVPQFEMGSLASTPGGSESVTTGNVLDRLRTTWWGTPSENSLRAVGLAMRSRLVDRASSGLPAARAWAAGAAALMVAREQVVAGNRLPPDVRRNLAHTLGQPALDADTVDSLREALPERARWVLDNVTHPEDMWRAECGWWARVDADGRELLRGSSFGPQPVVGAVAVMAADAWRVRAALHAAALGGAMEAFDALA